jgi:thiol-disulfide isomerase/thioredoxin
MSARATATRPSRVVAWFVFVALSGLTAVSGGCGGSTTSTAQVRAPRASGVATPALKVGEVLPPLEAEGWINGSPPTPASPGVKLLVVDAFGFWCPYCEQSAPGLLRTYEKYRGKGVAFVSLTSSSQDVLESFVRKHAVPWSNGYGVNAATAAKLGIGSGMPGPIDYEVAPTLYLVGPDGRIRWVDGRGRMRHQEPADWENAADAAIAAALAAPG